MVLEENAERKKQPKDPQETNYPVGGESGGKIIAYLAMIRAHDFQAAEHPPQN